MHLWGNDAHGACETHLSIKRVVLETGVHVHVLFVYPAERYIGLKDKVVYQAIVILGPLKQLSERVTPFYGL